jgi:integrase
MKIRKRKMANRTVFQADIFDATGKRIRKSFRTKGEAEEWLAEQKIEAGKPQPAVSPHRNATLQEWWNEWAPQQTATIEASTLDGYRQLFTRHITPTLGGFRVRDIHRRHIRALLATKRHTLSGNSTRLILATLSVLLGDAVGDEIISENPARALAQERRKRPDRVSKPERKHIRPLSREHLAIFLGAAARCCSPRDAVLYLTLADTGVRPSEGLALRYEDFDPVRRSLHVERAVSAAGTIKATKTGAARDVDVTRRLAEALSALQASAEVAALASGTDPSPYIFPTATGTFLERRNVSRRFREIMARTGLPKHRLYDLRHSFATHLLEANAPITYVSAQLGHASPVTTMRWYAAWIPTGDRSVIDRLEAARLGVTGDENFGFVTDVTDSGSNRESVTASEVPDTPAELLGEPSGTRTRAPLIKSSLAHLSTSIDPDLSLEYCAHHDGAMVLMEWPGAGWFGSSVVAESHRVSVMGQFSIQAEAAAQSARVGSSLRGEVETGADSRDDPHRSGSAVQQRVHASRYRGNAGDRRCHGRLAGTGPRRGWARGCHSGCHSEASTRGTKGQGNDGLDERLWAA